MCPSRKQGDTNPMWPRNLWIAAVVVATGFGLATNAEAESAAGVKRLVQAAYARRDSAAQNKDLNGSLATVTPDFVFISRDGQKGDSKLLKRRLTPLFAMVQSLKAKSELLKFAVRRGQADATVKQHLEMYVINPQTQTPQKYVVDAISEDLWIRTRSGWFQKRMTAKAESATMNGKRIDDRMQLSPGPHQRTGQVTKKAAK